MRVGGPLLGMGVGGCGPLIRRAGRGPVGAAAGRAGAGPTGPRAAGPSTRGVAEHGPRRPGDGRPGGADGHRGPAARAVAVAPLPTGSRSSGGRCTPGVRPLPLPSCTRGRRTRRVPACARGIFRWQRGAVAQVSGERPAHAGARGPRAATSGRAAVAGSAARGSAAGDARWSSGAERSRVVPRQVESGRVGSAPPVGSDRGRPGPCGPTRPGPHRVLTVAGSAHGPRTEAQAEGPPWAGRTGHTPATVSLASTAAGVAPERVRR
jgi:hypothetical protein